MFVLVTIRNNYVKILPQSKEKNDSYAIKLLQQKRIKLANTFIYKGLLKISSYGKIFVFRH